MKRFRRYGVGVVLLAALLVAAGCSLFSSKESLPDPNPLEPGLVLFSEDFSGQLIGDNGDELKQWSVHGGLSNRIQVVEDVDEVSKSGHVLHVKYDPADETDTTRTRLRSGPWDPRLAQAKKIGIEYKIKMITGSLTSNVGLLKTSSAVFVAMHHPTNGTRLTTRGTVIGNLNEDEWNHIRVIVDLKNQEYEVYLNDMENRVTVESSSNPRYQQGFFDFRDSFDSGTDTESVFMEIDQEGNASRWSEGYYSDFRVWVIE